MCFSFSWSCQYLAAVQRYCLILLPVWRPKQQPCVLWLDGNKKVEIDSESKVPQTDRFSVQMSDTFYSLMTKMLRYLNKRSCFGNEDIITKLMKAIKNRENETFLKLQYVTYINIFYSFIKTIIMTLHYSIRPVICEKNCFHVQFFCKNTVLKKTLFFLVSLKQGTACFLLAFS